MDCKAQLQKRKENLPIWQKILMKPAITCLQLGASMYLAELIRPYMGLAVVLSLATIAFILLQSLKETRVATNEAVVRGQVDQNVLERRID